MDTTYKTSLLYWLKLTFLFEPTFSCLKIKRIGVHMVNTEKKVSLIYKRCTYILNMIMLK